MLTRCYKSLIPTEDYINHVLSGVPDLYGKSQTPFAPPPPPGFGVGAVWLTVCAAGCVRSFAGPFWVPTTVIFSLFLTSSLSQSISAYLAGQSYTYDFTRLGAAVSLV